MADSENPPTDTPTPSTEQQISALQGDIREMKSTMFEFFLQFRSTGLPGQPPSRNPPPHSAPQPSTQPNPSNFHDQFSYAAPFPSSSGHPPFPAFQPQSRPPPAAGPANNPFGISPHLEEPVKLNEVWFSGEASQLEAFLKEIRDFIHHRSTRFPSDSRVIVWVSLHFGFRPSENRKGASKSQNWYMSLIRQNARLQNKLSPYADLERLEFVLPILASWEAFEAGFIKFFGDKFQTDTAKAALDACKQGSLSVEEYNTQFGSLAYLVDLTDSDRLLWYSRGLNLNIQKQVENSGWRALASLDDRMQVAAKAAKDLEIISRFSDPSFQPPKAKPAFPPHLYQHPHSTQRAPDAMDIDPTTAQATRRAFTPFERCIGFDGNEGVGGTVTHDWAGRIHVSSVDSKEAIPFPSSFGVTCLGTVDAIFGLPWLDRQSWTASGSASGGHRFTLRSMEVFVVDTCSLGEELEDSSRAYKSRHQNPQMPSRKSTGICMDPDKLSTVVDWPYPETICHLRKFLGFTNFYRKFIDCFSEVSAPLTKLTKNGIDVERQLKEEKCFSSFEHLKSCFTKAPLLQHFDFAKKQVLFVDSSKYALAAVLCQPGADGILRPVSFLSRKLTPREPIWQVHDQELFAIVNAFQEWRAWLIGTSEPVLVMSDHANLRYFMDSQKLSDRQARWAAFLVSFNFTIQHVSGKDNPADPATRRPDFITGNEDNEHHRQLLSSSTSGLRLSDSSLDNLTLREVDDLQTAAEPQGSNSAPPAPVESHIDLSDPGFCQPTHRLKQMLQEAYLREPPVTDEDDESPLTFEHGFWWLKDRIFAPSSIRPTLLQMFHDDISAGHVESLKTLQNLTHLFTWPGIRKDVIQYTKSCLSCQQAKHSNQQSPGLMIPLLVPERPWSIIGVDFIVKLPLSSSFDSILVIVDHFTKAAHLIPACENWSAEDFASCFLDRFVRYHGLPNKIVSDWGPIFVSRFWTETERTNQTIETFIQHFISHRQDDWSSLLPLAEIVFNSTVSVSTGYSPFFSQYAFHPRLNSLTNGSLVPAADSLVETLSSVQDELRDCMMRAKKIQKEYFDRRVRDAPAYKVGDLVWLLRKNISSQRPSPKLDFKKLGPFRIEACIGSAAYRLSLSPELKRLHPVFHTSLLLPFIDPQSFPGRLGPIVPWGPVVATSWELDAFDIDSIFGYRQLPLHAHTMTHEYLVTWQNGSTADNSWVKGVLLAVSLHPYLEQFHKIYGDSTVILSADKSIKIPSP
ncbi:hypothetical protein MJO29_007171 [Puccinia striiformis f. sp. tritici]|nr:hypothetical protein MJO29_007171 [Puccinia striiformis f. sp. tritici]